MHSTNPSNHITTTTPAALMSPHQNNKTPPLTVVFFPIAGGHAAIPRSMPSVHSTCAHVTTLLPTLSSTTQHIQGHDALKKVIVYLNFGLLHLLHVYPYRPWEFRNVSRLAQKAYRYADFQGFLNLENW
jgi:hypothetical protein